MDLSLSPSEQAFRDELAAWLKDHVLVTVDGATESELTVDLGIDPDEFPPHAMRRRLDRLHSAGHVGRRFRGIEARWVLTT